MVVVTFLKFSLLHCNDNSGDGGDDYDDNDNNVDDGDDDDDDNGDHLPFSRPHMAQGRIPRCTQALAERN